MGIPYLDIRLFPKIVTYYITTTEGYEKNVLAKCKLCHTYAFSIPLCDQLSYRSEVSFQSINMASFKKSLIMIFNTFIRVGGGRETIKQII